MISFNALLPMWLILFILILLSILFIWLERRRKQLLLIVRIASICLMMIALAGILLRPSYQVEKSSSLILLTKNYKKEKVDSLLHSQPELTLLHSADAPSYKGSKAFSYSTVHELENDIRFVVSDGLPLHALDLMDTKTFQFIASSNPEGATKLILNEPVVVNRKNIVSGIYHNASGKIRIILKGPAGKEDSISIDKNGDYSFHFSFKPKQNGNVFYELITQKENGDTSTEILPMHIEESHPLRILFLQSYPTFETQYLKTFLTSKEHRLLLRYQLSKNNFRYEYANMPSQSFNHLTSELLSRFDLVILDGEELKTLSVSEQVILNKSIQSGLGLLLMNIDPTKETKNRINFFPFQVQKAKTDTASLSLSESATVTLTASSYRATESCSVKSIIKNKSGILSGYQHRGLGKIGFQFLQQTYQLTLSGDSLNYVNLWSPVIERISRYNTSSSKIKIKNQFPIYQDDPIDIEIISSIENPILFADSIPTPLQENVLLDDVWVARTWAAEPGWHTLQLKDNASLQYYVSNPNDWKSLSISEQIKANQLASKTPHGTRSEKVMQSKMINSLLFYSIFVLASGFLWLAPKL